MCWGQFFKTNPEEKSGSNQTNFGKTIYTYVADSKIELKKVTWPTKQETTQTALGVIVIVVIIGILLWLLDMLLAWAIGTLYGVR